jgi:RNA polymerase sigma factor (TIGR02999 family)
VLLRQWSDWDASARERLVPIVYQELRRLAHYHGRHERDGHTLQTTALVHEAYLRQCGQDEPQWEDGAHFFAVVARMMRRSLVDYSRRRGADKRGADGVHIPLDDALGIALSEKLDLIALDGALEQLAAMDARKCQGRAAKDTALALKTSDATVRRDWTIGRAWLSRWLEGNAKA